MTDGYVGCTKNASKREREHFHVGVNNPSPLRGENPEDYTFSILAICDTKEKALAIEGLFRPLPNTGLSKMAGGAHGGNEKLIGRKSNNPSLDDDAIAQILKWKGDKYAPTTAMQAEILGCSIKTISNYRNQ
jgi:hypothetical protein